MAWRTSCIELQLLIRGCSSRSRSCSGAASWMVSRFGVSRMKKTEGFVTDDGSFFESQVEAGLHEAELRLRMQLAHLTAFPDLNADAFLAVVFEVRTQLRSYLDAHNAANTAKSDQQAEEQDRTTASDRR